MLKLLTRLKVNFIDLVGRTLIKHNIGFPMKLSHDSSTPYMMLQTRSNLKAMNIPHIYMRASQYMGGSTIIFFREKDEIAYVKKHVSTYQGYRGGRYD